MMVGVAEVGTTAVVVLLPAAQVLLTAAASVDPAFVRPGLPAHATIRYPFVPVTDELIGRLRLIGAGMPAIPVELSDIASEPGFLGVGVPELALLRDALTDAWPDPPLYGGRFGPSPPIHVTVGVGASDADMAPIRAEIAAHLPIPGLVTGMELLSLTSGGWRSHASIPFGGKPSL